MLGTESGQQFNDFDRQVLLFQPHGADGNRRKTLYKLHVKLVRENGIERGGLGGILDLVPLGEGQDHIQFVTPCQVVGDFS